MNKPQRTQRAQRTATATASTWGCPSVSSVLSLVCSSRKGPAPAPSIGTSPPPVVHSARPRRCEPLMRASLLLIAIALGSVSPTRAAGQSPAASVTDSSPFRPLDLPAPNDQRTGAGRPGPRYWQQRVDYRITATLDTARRRAARPRDDPLRERLAARAALSLAVRRAEHLQGEQHHRHAQPAAARLRRHRLRLLLRRQRTPMGSCSSRRRSAARR